MKLHWLTAKRWFAARRVADAHYRRFLKASLPSPSACFRDIEFVCLDMETTGLDPATAHVLSIGWVSIIEGFVDLSTAETLVVRPKGEVGDSAAVHGLTDSVVDRGVDPVQALDRVIEVLTGKVLVVHHAGLDKGLLDRVCRRRYGRRLYMPVVDTLALELRRHSRQHHIDENKSLRLPDLRKHYGLPWYAGHNCLTDAIATAELLVAMVATHGAGGETTLADLT